VFLCSQISHRVAPFCGCFFHTFLHRLYRSTGSHQTTEIAPKSVARFSQDFGDRKSVAGFCFERIGALVTAGNNPGKTVKPMILGWLQIFPSKQICPVFVPEQLIYLCHIG